MVFNDNSSDLERILNEDSNFKLPNKKQTYQEEVIKDKNGEFKFVDDPVEYKKARKYDCMCLKSLGGCRTGRVLSEAE